MSSTDHSLDGDFGLLTPVWAGTRVAAATGDVAFLQAMLDAEAALARAQATLGQAPGSAADEITAAAQAERFDVRGIAERARAGGNPVIPLVADLKAAVTDSAAPFVHRGATSQDIMDSAVMLVAARAVVSVLEDLRRTADALGGLAAEHRDTPMAGRTLTQHAVPTTFGLKTAGWRSLVLDAVDRLAAVRLPAQLGGAAGTLAAFEALGNNANLIATQTSKPGDASAADSRPGPSGASAHEAADGRHRSLDLVDAYAEELGLAAPDLPWHVLRTPVADLASALAFAIGALGKTAADVLVLSRTEIAEVCEATGGGSSAMPHKANPVRAALIASAARQAPALAAILLGALAVEDERPAGPWHAEWQSLRELLRLAGGAAETAAGLTENLRVFPDRMLENLHRTRGLVVSERLASELGALVGPGAARRLVTAAAEVAVARNLHLAEVLASVPELEGLIPEDRLRQLTDPAAYPGASAALVDRALRRTPKLSPEDVP